MPGQESLRTSLCTVVRRQLPCYVGEVCQGGIVSSVHKRALHILDQLQSGSKAVG